MAEESVASDLAKAYDNAVEASKPAEAAPAPAKEAEAPKAAAEPEAKPAEDKPRDEQGRFTPKTDAASVAEPAVKPVETTAAAPATSEVKPKLAYPSSWKKDHADKWETLPEEIRAEVLRREDDFHKGLHEIKETADFGRKLKEVVTPYMQTITALGVTPDVAVQALLNADHILRYSQPAEKAAYMRTLAQQYGVDLSEAAKEAPQVDPQVNALRQQLAQIQAGQQQFTQTLQQREAEQITQTLAAFKAQPGHEHMDEVREDMAALLSAGRAQDLQQAYDMAIWARPDIRAQQLAKERAETEKRIREEAAAKAAAAQKSSFVVEGQGAVGVAATKPGSLRSELEAAFSQLE